MKFIGLMLLFFFVSQNNNVFASHVGGCEITYEEIDTFKYEVTVKFYRNCDGINFGLLELSVNCSDDFSNFETFRLGSAKSTEFITKSCANYPVPCGNAGVNSGTEVRTYLDTLDLNLYQFSYLKSCGKLTLSAGSCCRGRATAHQTHELFYNYAEINFDETTINSSPKFTQNVQNKICCNKPFYYNTGAIDTINHDSLSYQWGQLLTSHSTNIGYSSNLSYNHPITAYYPSGFRAPTTIPNGLQNNGIPVGIFLNPQNGDIIFTPTSCGEESSAVIEVLEWRKLPTILSNGDTIYNMKNIGKVRRDQRFSIISCPENNPPVIQADFDHVICENTPLCFEITAIDKPVIGSISGTSSKLDTVRLSWNKTIKDATFSIISDTGRIDTAEFCWTPKIGDARSLPYNFVVEALDDACVLNSISTRSISITVEPFVETVSKIDSIGCGKYALQSSAIDTNVKIKNNQWYVLDSLGNIVDSRKVLYFESNHQTQSNLSLDTVVFKNNGTYIMVYSSNHCTPNYDTITITDVKNISILSEEQKVLCELETIALTPSLYNFNNPVRFQWGTAPKGPGDNFLIQEAQLLTGDTLKQFSFTAQNKNRDTAIFVAVTDFNGCTQTDWLSIKTIEKPKITLNTPPVSCYNDSIHLKPDVLSSSQIRSSNVSWFLNDTLIDGENDFSLSMVKSGVYKFSVTNRLGCSAEKSVDVIKNDAVPVKIGDDREICFQEEVKLRARDLDTNNADKEFQFAWIDMSNGNKIISTKAEHSYTATTFKRWQFRISVSQNDLTCNETKEVKVAVKPLPQIFTPDNKDVITQCFSYQLPSLINGNYFSNIGGQGDQYFPGDTISESKLLYVFANQNGCEANKSFDIIINQFPQIETIDDVVICESYTLPNLSLGQYFDAANRQGNQLFARTIIQSNKTIFVSAVNDCGITEEQFTVDIIPKPNVSFSKVDNQLEATELDAQYQWFDCEADTSPIMGAIFQNFTPERSGIYALEVTKNGCTDISACFNFNHSNNTKLDLTALGVYPNPFKNSFTINLGNHQNISIVIYDIQGKIIYSDTGINSQYKEIALDAASGIYNLELRNNFVTKNIKIVKE